MKNGHVLFSIGDAIDFNRLGIDQHINIPPTNPDVPWRVVKIIPQVSPPAPHPQLIDLGEKFPIGPVSGMFLEKQQEGK